MGIKANKHRGRNRYHGRGKKVLDLAGITDVLSRTKGQTRTTINYAAATFNALKNLNITRITNEQREKLYINKGRMFE